MSDAIKASKISVFSNVLLTILKFLAGIFVGSTALIADAIHSFVDILGSIFVWLGIKISEKPADKSHPYGHFKAESLAELAVGLVVILSSVAIIREALDELLSFSSPSFEYFALLVALISALANEGLARYKIAVGKKERSIALIAEGKHSRVDVLASLSVFFGFLFVKLGYWWADGIVAIIISALILQIGLSIIKSSIDVLMDSVDEELALQITEIVKRIEGVEEIELIATRGTWKAKIIEIHFAIRMGASSEEIERIQKEIENEIKSRFLDVISVIPVVRFKRENVVIAIPSDKEGEKYTKDFGSKYYTIIEFDKDFRILSKKTVENPYLSAEKRKGYLIAEFLKRNHVNVVIAKKIGEGGKDHLRSKGISLIELDGEKIEEVVDKAKISLGYNISQPSEL